MENIQTANPVRQSGNNGLATSPQAKTRSEIPKEYIEAVYRHCGIPPKFCVLSLSELETDGRAEELWESVLERAGTWKNGYSEKRGILTSGPQGSGKSTSLFFQARAAIKSYIISNPPADFRGLLKVPVFVCEFPEWLRFQFCPQTGKDSWNFDLLDKIANSRSIFIDDLTIDPNAEAFKPVREFLYLLVNRLSNMVTPPALYISTNNTSAEWDSLLGSQFVDRITGHKHGLCEIKKCDWKSYRNG